MIEATVTNRIRLPYRDDIAEWARRNLQLTNPAYNRAEREMARFDEIPQEIKLFHESMHFLDLPRGCWKQLGGAFADISFSDKTVVGNHIDTRNWKTPKLRNYQHRAQRDILWNHDGVYEAPPGAGKTVVVLDAIREIKVKSLVIVNRSNIATQWVDRAEEHFGFRPGLIGDGEWNEQDVTIAMQQTLWARYAELEALNFWDDWGFVCLDETHHASARTFYDVLDRFPARRRIGVSATPVKDPELEPFIRGVIGPTFHVTTSDDLVKEGVGVKPRVIVVETDFKHAFWPTHKPNTPKQQARYGLKCQYEKHGCKSRGKVHRNNYQKLADDLVRDEARNRLIGKCIVDSISPHSQIHPRACLVVTKRLEHIDLLSEQVQMQYTSLWGFLPRIEFLIGEKQREEREAIINMKSEDFRGIVIFSTIADEALDIPRLDAIFLVYPGRNVKTVQQQVGRVERGHPDKSDPIVVDFSDPVGILQSQLDGRIEWYEERGMEIDLMPRTDAARS